MKDLAWLWEASLRGSGLILLALLLRMTSKRLPKWALSWLWTAAALRLLVPVNLMIPVQGTQRVAGLPAPGASAEPGSAGLPWFCWAVWAVGAGLSLACLLLRAWLAHRQIRQAAPLEDPFCRQLMDRQRLRRPVQLLVCEQIGTPLTCGLLRPKILLPRQMDLTDRQGLACALTHELAHIRRLDALRKGLTRAALCLHWFNPLVWMLVCLADRDLEQACDEKALSLLGTAQKGAYARALLRLAEQNSCPAPLHSGFCLAGQNGLEERIGSIMKYQKISRRVALAAALAVAAAATVSAAELKPVEPDVDAAAQAEYEVPNSVELDPATTVTLKKQDNSTETYTTTLLDGQQVSYTLNHDRCQDLEGGVCYTVGHHISHHHH